VTCVCCGRAEVKGKKTKLEMLPSGISARLCCECKTDRYRIRFAEAKMRRESPDTSPRQVKIRLDDAPKWIRLGWLRVPDTIDRLGTGDLSCIVQSQDDPPRYPCARCCDPMPEENWRQRQICGDCWTDKDALAEAKRAEHAS
jgi:hypothetical protein